MGLTITRCVGEAFIIDDNVVVTLTRISGSEARIQVDAPASMLILRKEICAAFRGKHRRSKDILADLMALADSFRSSAGIDPATVNRLDDIIRELGSVG